MKRLTIAFIVLTFALVNAYPQRYMTKTGYIGFFSHTPIEDIKADNNQVAGVLDVSTGELVFQVLVNAFQFEKALMQEHFNENYMESEKYPRATYKGKITNMSSVDLSKPGKYEVNTEGDLNIHNTTRTITTKGTIEVLPEGLQAGSKFNIAPEDYGIKIPGLVRDKIAKNVEVTVLMKYTPVGN